MPGLSINITTNAASAAGQLGTLANAGASLNATLNNTAHASAAVGTSLAPLGASYANLATQLSAYNTVATGFGAAAAVTATSLNVVTAGSNTAAAATTRVASALAPLGADYARLTQQVTAYNSAVSLTSRNTAATLSGFRLVPPAIAPINNSVNSAAYTLGAFNNVLRDAPFGFIAIQNNIPVLTDAFARLVTSTGSVGGAFKSLLSVVAGPAGIGLAISLLTSGLTLYFQQQQQAKKATEESKNAIQSLADTERTLTTNVKSNTASAAAEAAQLTRLAQIAGDDAKSRQERTNALTALKKASDGYLDSLTLENINTDKARKSLDDYNESLFKSALVKAYQSNVEDLAKAFAANGDKAEALKKQIADVNAEYAKRIKNTFADETIGEEPKYGSLRIQLEAQRREKVNDLIKEGNKYTQQQLDIQDAIGKKGQEIADLQSKITGATVKAAETSADVYKKLGQQLDAINIKSDALGTSLSDKNVEKINAIKDAIGSLAHIQSTTTITSEITNSQKFISALKEQADELIPGSIDLTEKDLKTYISIDPVITFKSLQPNIEAAQKALVNGMVKVRNTASREADDFSKVVNTSLTRAGASLGEGLGEAVGAVISGTSTLGDALSSLIGVMGGFIEDFGKSLVEAATLRIIAEKTLIANPYVALAAGIAAIAIGSALKDSAPHFATGGQTFGPQLAVIGDNPSGREFVIPSEVMDKLGGGGGLSDGMVVGQINGSDLDLVFRRFNKTKRNNG